MVDLLATNASRVEYRLTGAVFRYEGIRSTLGLLLFVTAIEVGRRSITPTAWRTWVGWVEAVAFVMFVIEITVLNRRMLEHTLVTLSPQGVSVHTGRIIMSDSETRLDAILSTEVKSGPLLRLMGLRKVELMGVGTLPPLPVLPAHAAEALQALVASHRTEMAAFARSIDGDAGPDDRASSS